MGDECQFCGSKHHYCDGRIADLKYFKTTIEIDGVFVRIEIAYHEDCLWNSYEFNGKKILEFK